MSLYEGCYHGVVKEVDLSCTHQAECRRVHVCVCVYVCARVCVCCWGLTSAPLGRQVTTELCPRFTLYLYQQNMLFMAYGLWFLTDAWSCMFTPRLRHRKVYAPHMSSFTVISPPPCSSLGNADLFSGPVTFAISRMSCKPNHTVV